MTHLKTEPNKNNTPIKRALISVSDKTGVLDFVRFLQQFNVEIISTGGTAKMIAEAGYPVCDVSEITKFPEILDGRVKTLHPLVHGGLLGRHDLETHIQAMKEHKIMPIDMVIVNLYPFVQTVQNGASFGECIENIDIGGPAMIRAAAKNHDFVTVITDPQDYTRVMDDMLSCNGSVRYETRKTLAANAYAMTAAYDTNVASWFTEQLEDQSVMPTRFSMTGLKKQDLRYGENPHQNAAFYVTDGMVRPGVATAAQLQGKELSYNNINDTHAAFELVSEFDQPTVAIIKHANPCGVATSKTIENAYQQALRCDPVSAFGGIIALNRSLTLDLAREIIKGFVEVIIAPDVEKGVMEILKAKPNIRLLSTSGRTPDPLQRRMMVTSMAGGFLYQEVDAGVILPENLRIVTKRQPTAQEIEDMIFAFRVAKHVKSNAIVYAKNQATVGIGAGQMSRIDSSRIAAHKAEEISRGLGLKESLAIGSVVASDAFFPFADGLLAAADAGATAIIQPGGSMRDQEVIEAADSRNLAMVFTGQRHFRH